MSRLQMERLSENYCKLAMVSIASANSILTLTQFDSSLLYFLPMFLSDALSNIVEIGRRMHSALNQICAMLPYIKIKCVIREA